MVAATPNTIHPVGDEDSSKRRQILDGARKVFMDLGFDGASMDEIARAAGVSKGTLYVYFADKNRLFEAIVEEEALEQGKIAFNFDPAARRRDHAAGIRPGLYRIALPAGRRIVDPHRDGDRRADAGCRPPLSTRTCWRKPSTASPTISQAHVGPGDLAIDDCQLAASQFMEMCQASLFLPFVFQAAPAPSAERIARGGRQRDADVSADVPGEAEVGPSSISPGSSVRTCTSGYNGASITRLELVFIQTNNSAVAGSNLELVLV